MSFGVGDDATSPPSSSERQQRHGSELEALARQIRDLLQEQRDIANRPAPFYRKHRTLIIAIAALGLLCIVDFPDDRLGGASVVARNGSKLSIVKLSEVSVDATDSDLLFFGAPAPQRLIPERIGLVQLWVLEAWKGDVRYATSRIFIVREENGVKMKEIALDGHTKLRVVIPFESENDPIRKSAAMHYGLAIDGQIVPLNQFIREDGSGSLMIAATPRIGYERFASNLSRAWDLLF